MSFHSCDLAPCFALNIESHYVQPYNVELQPIERHQHLFVTGLVL
jgi:hypothetical protein